MRQVRIERFCDVCYADGEELTEATTTWTIGVVDAESRPVLRELETCDVHGKQYMDIKTLISELPAYTESSANGFTARQQALFSKAAQSAKSAPVPEKKGSPSRVDPVSCEICGHTVTRAALVTHVWNKHRTDEKPAAPETCPDCDFTSTPAGIGVHRMSAHAFDALEEAYSGVPGYRQKYAGSIKR